MNTSLNPTQALNRVTRSLRAFRYGEQLRPLRDWLVIVTVIGILLVLSAVWSYFVYYRFTKESTSAAAPAAVEVNTASLATVRTVFEKRALERTRYLSEYHFVDPSK